MARVDAVRRDDPAPGDSEESLKDALSHTLDEARMVLPGVQALFGFQLIAVFNDGFGEKLSHADQLVHLVALLLTVLATVLVMTPAALQRHAEPREVSERFVWLASNLLLAAMYPLPVAVKSHRHGDCSELKDLPGNVLDEIEQFFVAFNASKRGSFRPLARRGAAAATRLVERGERRFAGER